MSCTALQQLLDAADKAPCFSTSTAASEKGKTFRFDNSHDKTVCRVRVDGCLIISTATKKCDYLFHVLEDAGYYLVELKGTDVEQAVEQILQTFEQVNARIKAKPQQYTGVIVSSSVPAGTQQRFRKLQDKIFGQRHIRLKKTHFQHVEVI